MANKSIIDRVLLAAALICAAGLIWQLTVLLTSKGKPPTARTLAVATTASAAPNAGAAPNAAAAPNLGAAPKAGTPPHLAAEAAPATADGAAPPAPKPETPTVRVVYPGIGTPAVFDVPKTTAKVTDTPSAAPLAPFVPAPGLVPVALVSPDPLPEPAPEMPTAGEAPTSPPAAPTAVAALDPAADPAPKLPGGGVNINNASIEALNRLDGGGRIGQAIASHRPYRSVDELLKKRVLRRDVFERIRGQIAAE